MKKALFLLFSFFSLNIWANKGEELFPDINGWILSIKDIVYTSDNLWEFNDGAADVYLVYDFQYLHLADYKQEKKSVQVEIYNHNDLSNAFGIYTRERMPEYFFIDIGVQGYYEPGVLNFFTGKYYIKIISSGEEESSKEDMIVIALNLNVFLGQKNSWPKQISYLPLLNMIKYSESYISEDFLGYNFLHSAFTANYKSEENEYQIFIIELTNPLDADTMIDNYTKMFKEEKIRKEENIIMVEDVFNGLIYLNKFNNFIIGIINLKNDTLAKDMIKDVTEKIKKQ